MSLGQGSFKEPGISTVDENTYSLGALHREHKKNYKISYKYRDFSEIQDAHNYKLEYKGPLFFIDQVRLKHGYENVTTARAARAGVKYFENSFALDQTLPLNFFLTSRYQFNRYNDSNKRHSERAGLFYTLFKKPNMKIGYEADYKDSEFHSRDYSTPESLRIHQAKIRLYDDVAGSRLYYDVSYGAGYAFEKGVENKRIESVEIYIEYNVTDSFSCYVYYDLFEDPTYNGETVQGAVKFRF